MNAVGGDRIKERGEKEIISLIKKPLSIKNNQVAMVKEREKAFHSADPQKSTSASMTTKRRVQN